MDKSKLNCWEFEKCGREPGGVNAEDSTCLNENEKFITGERRIRVAKEKDKSEISEEARKGIYGDVWKMQSELSPDDPDYDEKLQKAYPVAAKRYQVSEDIVKEIYSKREMR